MHASALRIALLLALAMAASVAATWTKAWLDSPPSTHLHSGQQSLMHDG